MKTTHELIENSKGRFYYLASPYSHDDPQVRDIRAAEVNRYAGLLMAQGVYCIPTIYLTHENAKRFGLPTDHVWWIGFNKALIDPSAGMIIAQLPGWDESKGIVQEINYCRSVGKPVTMMHVKRNGDLVIAPYPGR